MLNRFFKNIINLYTSRVMKKEILAQDSSSDNEAPESYGITEQEHSQPCLGQETLTTESVGQDETTSLVEEVTEEVPLDPFVKQLIQGRIAELQTAVEDIPATKKVARSDPYAGYLAPNGRNKRQKTKKKRILEHEEAVIIESVEKPASVEYNGVVVSYDKDTMPPDMTK